MEMRHFFPDQRENLVLTSTNLVLSISGPCVNHRPPRGPQGYPLHQDCPKGHPHPPGHRPLYLAQPLLRHLSVSVLPPVTPASTRP